MGIRAAYKQIRGMHKEHSRCREDTCSAARRYVKQQSKHEVQLPCRHIQQPLLILVRAAHRYRWSPTTTSCQEALLGIPGCGH